MVCSNCSKKVDRNERCLISSRELRGLGEEGRYRTIEFYLCRDCLDTYYSRCRSCDYTFKRKKMKRLGANQYLCPLCQHDNITMSKCESCGIWNSGSFKRCYYCRENNYNTEWHSYCYKPEHHWYIDKSRDEAPYLYLGVELEIDKEEYETEGVNYNPWKFSKALRKASKAFYCKSDASLNYGVEVVSHPATLNAHYNILPWKTVRSLALKSEFTSHPVGSCGLHVHVNKNWFTLQELLKLDAFMALCNSQCKIISRRKDFEFCHFKNYSPALLTNVPSRLMERGALHLTKRTVEFRLFRGTLYMPSFYASLEWVDAICRFIKGHPSTDIINGDADTNWVAFCDFIYNADEDYHKLAEYLHTKGLWNAA